MWFAAWAGFFVVISQIVVRPAIGTPATGSSWDFFVFAQEWPESVCTYVNSTGKECVVPSNVTTWTIHGLWPTADGSRGPVYCNDTWHFDERKIKVLEPRLRQLWPNLYKDTTATDFWKHEWTKHGTCCTDLAATRDEYYYFLTTLALNGHYDLKAMLAKHNIISGQEYSLNTIQEAVEKEIRTDVRVFCTTVDGRQYINSIELCLDRTFRSIDCDREEIPLDRHANTAWVHEWYKSPANGEIEANECSSYTPVNYPKHRI